jgi:CspA family cold shock protein
MSARCLAKTHLCAYVVSSTFGRTIGPYRLRCTPGARSDFSPNIDEGASDRAVARPPLKCTNVSERTLQMTKGTVKFYNDQKGFGFIQPDDGGKDVFVHATALERAGMRGLVQGQKVAFDTQEDRRTGKIAVANIQAA